MHAQTHVLSGWCLGNLFALSGRERLLCMLAAGLADLDGLGILAGEKWFAEYHHVLGHNFLYGLMLAAILAGLSVHRLKAFGLYLMLFHLHLLGDYYSCVPSWRIHYFWPFDPTGWRPSYGWRLYSWQNILAAAVLIGWTIRIAVRAGRTPLEVLMPSLDRQLVAWLRVKAGRHPVGPEGEGTAVATSSSSGERYGQIQERQGHEGGGGSQDAGPIQHQER